MTTGMTKEQQAALSDILGRAALNYNAGRFDAAFALLDEAEATHGDVPEINHLSGLVLYAKGEREAGMMLLEEAADTLPENGAVQADIGALLAQEGKYEEALAFFETATELAPKYAPAWSNLGGAYYMLERYTEAIRPLRKAIEIDPNLLDAHLNLATAMAHANQHRRAIDAFYKVLSIDPNAVAAHLGLSASLYRAERHDAAVHHAQKALELRPNLPQAHLHLGNALASMGQMDEAAAHLQHAARARGGLGALARLINLRKTTRDSVEFAQLSAALERIDHLGRQGQQMLHYAAGKAFADLGDIDRSFEHYAKGNAITAEDVSFDEDNLVAQVDRMIEVVTPALIERVGGEAGVDEIAPVFICGMPRSGTTLTELMLSRHSHVQAGGELNIGIRALARNTKLVKHMEGANPDDPTADDFTRVVEFYVGGLREEGLTRRIVTDKMPINYINLGLLSLALPRAKFLIMRRHPLDCCLSNWVQNFGRNQPFSTNLSTLGKVYTQYHRMSEYWASLLPDRVRIQSYEALVTDAEAQIREILAF